MNNDDYISMSSEKQIRKEKIEKITRPYLLKRMVCGLLDLVMVFIVLFIFQYIAKLTLYKPLGYQESLETILRISDESGLFVKINERSYIEVSKYYQDTTELEQNYDEKITYYYTNDQRAINNNKLDSYKKAKEDSNYFDYNDNKYVKKADISDDQIVAFYEQKYAEALTFFRADENYRYASSNTFNIAMYSFFISMLVSSSIFYLLIPLLNKEGETIGQLIGKICLIDARDGSKVKPWQILVRFIVLFIINFFIPFFIYKHWGRVILISDVATVFIMSFTRKTKGPQDFASLSMVILKHRADAMDTLKVMVGR